MRTFEAAHQDQQAKEEEKKAQAPPAAAGAPAAAPAAAAPPKPDLPIFRINITLFIMALTCLLLGIIVHNSGRTTTMQLPRALIFVLDGVSGIDVQKAAARQRAPFISMLSEVGSSSLGLGATGCTHMVSDSNGLVKEIFTGTPYNRATVLKQAIDAGLGVTVIGDYPLLDEPGGHGCGALNNECPESCLSLAVDGGRCNYRAAFRETRLDKFQNTTLAAFLARGSQIVVVRLPIVPLDPNNELSRHSALYLADSALGRTAMAILERTAASGENLMIMIAAANATQPSAYLSVSAFKAAGQINLKPLVSTTARPAQLGDVPTTIAAWFGLDQSIFVSSIAQAVCSIGAVGADCPAS